MSIVGKIFRRSNFANDRFDGIEIGDEAQDTLSGFSGIVVALCSHISGCDQVCLQPPAQDGTFRESQWFDVERIEVARKGAVTTSSRQTGGDVKPPKRTSSGPRP